MGLCIECDVRLNEIVLEFFRFDRRRKRLALYEKEFEGGGAMSIHVVRCHCRGEPRQR